MLLSDFDYHLPSELIARYPLAERSASRLLQLDRQTGAVTHGVFKDLLDWLQPGDLLVFNKSKVIPARLYGHKPTGGKIELLVERVISEHEVLAHMRSNKTPKSGAKLQLANNHEIELLARQGDLFKFRFSQPVLEVLHEVGHMPLPPYMEREDEELDLARYQTVYADTEGSVAAPTAGLHFDEALLAQLKAKGIEMAYVTLHVGAGTFQSVRAEVITEHKMHAEIVEVNQQVVAAVQTAKQRGARVVAVGTTSVRSLESASLSGKLQTFNGETDIFIYPGYQFQCIDAMVTNFHLPKSSLLMLVSAFAGRENILAAYQAAIAEGYRFYSYGDAMLIG